QEQSVQGRRLAACVTTNSRYSDQGQYVHTRQTPKRLTKPMGDNTPGAGPSQAFLTLSAARAAVDLPLSTARSALSFAFSVVSCTFSAAFLTPFLILSVVFPMVVLLIILIPPVLHTCPTPCLVSLPD